MSKYIPQPPLKFLAIKKHKDGGEQVFQRFATKSECLRWIKGREKPKDDSWRWCVGEY